MGQPPVAPRARMGPLRAIVLAWWPLWVVLALFALCFVPIPPPITERELPDKPVRQVQGRLAPKMVSVGDRYLLGPDANHRIPCTVVEVIHDSDDGSATFSTGARVTALKEAGVPIISWGDEYASWYLLQQDSDPTKYAVGFFDPYWGERIQPGTPTAEAIDETLVMAWKCPDIKIGRAHV